MGNEDYSRAQHALIDPLIEAQPSEETGLNSHFGSTFAPKQAINPPSPPASAGLKGPSASIRPQETGSSVETNPYRRSRASSAATPRSSTFVSPGELTPKRRGHEHQRSHDYPSPPNSASPRREHFSHRHEAFGSLNETGRPRRSSQPSNPFKDGRDGNGAHGGLIRGGSLRERYPGDKSHRPLDLITKDTTKAYRAHHLRKKNFTGADLIDRLDKTGGMSYHHEGPYDAANISRNLDYKHSPVAAVQDSNEEALRATPRENILDAVSRHRPIEGVANIPPGMPDRFGRILNYEEGADLQREPGGDYRRYPGVQYHPNDLKGKGEPSYSIEKALKDHKKYGDTGIEMKTHRRNQSLDTPEVFNVPTEGVATGSGLGRSNTTGRSVSNVLKKRFGSIRRKKVSSEAT